jgi:hypothetical protein
LILLLQGSDIAEKDGRIPYSVEQPDVVQWTRNKCTNVQATFEF